MGYRIEVTVNKKISEKDIDKIVYSLPEKLATPLGIRTKQSWGWSTGLDVWNPENNEIHLGGSYGVSGKISEEYVLYFTEELKKLGYEILKINWSY